MDGRRYHVAGDPHLTDGLRLELHYIRVGADDLIGQDYVPHR